MGKYIPHDNGILLQGPDLASLNPPIRRTEETSTHQSFSVGGVGGAGGSGFPQPLHNNPHLLRIIKVTYARAEIFFQLLQPFIERPLGTAIERCQLF